MKSGAYIAIPVVMFLMGGALGLTCRREKPTMDQPEVSKALVVLNDSFEHDNPATLLLTTPDGEKMRVVITWTKPGAP